MYLYIQPHQTGTLMFVNFIKLWDVFSVVFSQRMATFFKCLLPSVSVHGNYGMVNVKETL